MKMKNVFCLSCGKKISVKSRYCRYCGELQKRVKTKKRELVWVCDFCEKEFSSKKESDKHELTCSLNPKNNKFPYNTNPKKAWIFLWISTLIAFGVSTFISAKLVNQNITLMNRTVLLVIYFANILIGIISFILIPFSSKKVNGKKNSLLVKYCIPLCILYLLIAPAIFASEGFKAKNNEEYRKKFYASSIQDINPSPTPTYSSLKSSLLIAVNEYRQDQKLDILTLDGDLCEVAKRLVSKINTLDGEINRKDYIDLCPTCSQIGVNSGKGKSADEILNLWKESTDSKVKNNLVGKYKYGCADTSGNDYVFVFANKSTSTQQKTSNTNTNSTNNSGSVECIGPDGKHFQTTMDECTKLNQQWGKPVDYMVSCNIHTDCGGGTVWMSKSQCDKPCSGLPNKSDNTQTNNVPASNTTTNTQNTSNKVQFNATETSIPGTYYCYENKVNEMVTQQSLTKGARELYETCKDSTYNEQVFKDCWNSNCEGLPDTNDCADSCYSQAFGECKGYYEDYLGYRSKLDKMRWDNCP